MELTETLSAGKKEELSLPEKVKVEVKLVIIVVAIVLIVVLVVEVLLVVKSSSRIDGI